MLTILFIVGRTTLFTPVDINLEQVVDFLNFYACSENRNHDLRGACFDDCATEAPIPYLFFVLCVVLEQLSNKTEATFEK